MAGWEAWTLPLCYAVPPKILTVFNVNSWFLALSSSLAVCHGTGSPIVPLSFLLEDIFHESELPMFVNHGSRQKRGPRQIIFSISFVLLLTNERNIFAATKICFNGNNGVARFTQIPRMHDSSLSWNVFQALLCSFFQFNNRNTIVMYFNIATTFTFILVKPSLLRYLKLVVNLPFIKPVLGPILEIYWAGLGSKSLFKI